MNTVSRVETRALAAALIRAPQASNAYQDEKRSTTILLRVFHDEIDVRESLIGQKLVKMGNSQVKAEPELDFSGKSKSS